MINQELNLNIITRKELRTSVTSRQNIKFNIIVLDNNSCTVYNKLNENILYTTEVVVNTGVECNNVLRGLAGMVTSTLSGDDIPFTISRFLVELDNIDESVDREVVVFVRIHWIDTLNLYPGFNIELTKTKDVFPNVESEQRLLDLLSVDEY